MSIKGKVNIYYLKGWSGEDILLPINVSGNFCYSMDERSSWRKYDDYHEKILCKREPTREREREKLKISLQSKASCFFRTGYAVPSKFSQESGKRREGMGEDKSNATERIREVCVCVGGGLAFTPPKAQSVFLTK